MFLGDGYSVFCFPDKCKLSADNLRQKPGTSGCPQNNKLCLYDTGQRRDEHNVASGFGCHAANIGSHAARLIVVGGQERSRGFGIVGGIWSPLIQDGDRAQATTLALDHVGFISLHDPPA
jgi:hypothetical protein